jgi:signal transduction histidine kinase
VLLFAASVAALGAITYLATSVALERRLDVRIEREMTSLRASFQSSGIDQLVAEVRKHEQSHPNGLLDYLVVGPRGEPLAGHLSRAPARSGWANRDYSESDGDVTRLRVLVAPLPGGVRLVIAADREPIEEIKQAILFGFLSAFSAVIALGTLGGIALSLALLKRVETIRRTAEAIIAGDLSQRVPVRGTNDDLDRLSQTLNQMLDRIAELMESLRQVSADIAHDLKTPLARLRQRLETVQAHAQSVDEQNLGIEAAIIHIDEILATFGALLRISQIEAGTRRAGFRTFDLSDTFIIVTDAFAPAAEDAGKTFTAKISPDIRILGDRELLTQMLANVVDNAIRHTPSGTRIAVSLVKDHNGIVGTVADNGPGAPAEEHQRLFQRFYRLEQSRSTPGNGLGLSLVKAVADLHGIALDIRDAGPGLQVVMRFSDAPQT